MSHHDNLTKLAGKMGTGGKAPGTDQPQAVNAEDGGGGGDDATGKQKGEWRRKKV